MALDIETDRRFEEKWWRFERISWVFMLAIVLAAVAGLTGRGGPLASAKAQAGELEVTYPRVARWQTAADMTVEFPPRIEGMSEILIPAEFADAFSIDSVSPRPSKVIATPEGTRFQFEVEAGPKPKSASFALRARKPTLWTRIQAQDAAAPSPMSFIILP